MIDWTKRLRDLPRCPVAFDREGPHDEGTGWTPDEVESALYALAARDRMIADLMKTDERQRIAHWLDERATWLYDEVRAGGDSSLYDEAKVCRSHAGMIREGRHMDGPHLYEDESPEPLPPVAMPAPPPRTDVWEIERNGAGGSTYRRPGYADRSGTPVSLVINDCRAPQNRQFLLAAGLSPDVTEADLPVALEWKVPTSEAPTSPEEAPPEGRRFPFLIVGIHPYTYRTGQIATAVATCKVRGRDCLAVVWPDGGSDTWPCCEEGTAWEAVGVK